MELKIQQLSSWEKQLLKTFFNQSLHHFSSEYLAQSRRQILSIGELRLASSTPDIGCFDNGASSTSL